MLVMRMFGHTVKGQKRNEEGRTAPRSNKKKEKERGLCSNDLAADERDGAGRRQGGMSLSCEKRNRALRAHQVRKLPSHRARRPIRRMEEECSIFAAIRKRTDEDGTTFRTRPSPADQVESQTPREEITVP